MFGALNRIIERLDSDPVQRPRSPSTGDRGFGFQVLRNKDAELPLEPWFDFIIGINGRLIEDPDPNLFATEVRNCAGSSVAFEIWSAKGQRTHTVSIPVPVSNPTLGLALQLAPLSSAQHIWHILNIPSPLSPAYRAGLLPHSDYIVGTPSGTLRGESALGELVEDHLNRTLVLWVYNSEFDVVREVELVPTRGWGGQGALGAELGYGALHRLPVGLGEEVEEPGEVVFETQDDGTSAPVMAPRNPTQNAREASPAMGGHFLVPANMSSPPPLASQAGTAPGHATSSTRRGKTRHAGVSPNRAFDEYFAEGEQKSKEQDFAPSRKASPLPPPPKAGVRPPPTAEETSEPQHE
ncbi:hypothetical protein EYZ11_003026 [Aspergillus tanneri]|uniref:PDZ GRASP-type domain-containing protein n=1 Tax=Aspergillus tanneri TaxID=1220188 RepID=A0A4S3JPF0_9EURO|nr:uncharacterized protein ATNIH1004_008677 [Aspergillus tanneri]KAA8644473.1 hypothetical protein ATNIH1004_008677 [Aspergillus tanneri]THC97492.1 hypothetical protein EYZ11_003026 [Aspergillus tanneri]